MDNYKINNPEKPPRYTFISPPFAINMHEQWFEIASIDHFWIKRRFEVCQWLMYHNIPINSTSRLAEIGCGNGLLQRQVEDTWNVPVDGFDLNQTALNQNISRLSELFFYNILEKHRQFIGSYQLIFMFDVLEHIEEQDIFLDAAKMHLEGGGRLIINVPADMRAYSVYDQAVGHIRRYMIDELHLLAERHHLTIEQWTYWGLPLYPLLWIRKYYLKLTKPDEIIKNGMSSRQSWLNKFLLRYSRLEPMPQRKLGSSLMVILRAK